jgi:pyruvate kinase
MRRTKIVATVGPASESVDVLRQMVEAGLNVARLNFSHGSHAWHAQRIGLLRQLAEEAGRPLAILQDLSGPKLRLGEIDGALELHPGDVCLLTARAEDSTGQEPIRIPLPVPKLVAALQPGNQIFLDDGLMELLVVGRDGAAVRCEVVTGGTLTSRKGVTVRGVSVDIPSLTKRDREDLRLGLQHGVDWVALSYVRRAADLEPARQLMAEVGTSAPILAKIEKWEAVQNLEELVTAADGLMVARGDLGVEMPLTEVPAIQKRIIRACNRAGKPVITATQMLDSMIRNPRPTRAEVSDVANAILDGTDAVMLSGETAVGAHPLAAIRFMDEIAQRTEEADVRGQMSEVSRSESPPLLTSGICHLSSDVTSAISDAACQIAHDLGVEVIVASTTSGQTARMISRHRPRALIVGATASPATYRRLALSWGVHPLLCAPTTNTDAMLDEAVSRAMAAGLVGPGDTVVISAGVPVGIPGNTNLIKVRQL